MCFAWCHSDNNSTASLLVHYMPFALAISDLASSQVLWTVDVVSRALQSCREVRGVSLRSPPGTAQPDGKLHPGGGQGVGLLLWFPDRPLQSAGKPPDNIPDGSAGAETPAM